ncbi:MAG: single-stranded DNA-binding protein [Campylobacterales bacterium]|nr:single-stranded DNA-binding protein [Campylobacterales bacterium]
MLNKVILIGNLTRDVELKYTQGGSAIANLGLATNRRWKDRNTGENKEEVTFVDITVFGRQAETANQYLRKGSKVLIEGRLKFDQWTDQNGQNRSKLSVTAESLQFLDTKEQNGGGNYNQGGDNNQQQGGYNQPQNGGYNQNNNGGGYDNNFSQPAPSQPQNTQSAPPPIEDDEIPF